MAKDLNPTQREHPIELEDVPDEEDVSLADAAERLETTPEDQVNRTDQPDFDPKEREQF